MKRLFDEEFERVRLSEERVKERVRARIKVKDKPKWRWVPAVAALFIIAMAMLFMTNIEQQSAKPVVVEPILSETYFQAVYTASYYYSDAFQTNEMVINETVNTLLQQQAIIYTAQQQGLSITEQELAELKKQLRATYEENALAAYAMDGVQKSLHLTYAQHEELIVYNEKLADVLWKKILQQAEEEAGEPIQEELVLEQAWMLYLETHLQQVNAFVEQMTAMIEEPHSGQWSRLETSKQTWATLIDPQTQIETYMEPAVAARDIQNAYWKELLVLREEGLDGYLCVASLPVFIEAAQAHDEEPTFAELAELLRILQQTFP